MELVGTNREEEMGILACITLALAIMCGYEAATAAATNDGNSNLSRPNKRMAQEISKKNDMDSRPLWQWPVTIVVLMLESNSETRNKESQTMEEVYLDLGGRS